MTQLACLCCCWVSAAGSSRGNRGEGRGLRSIPVSRTTEAFSCLAFFPQGGPSHPGDSVAPETMGRVTMGYLQLQNQEQKIDFFQMRMLAELREAEGLDVEKLGCFRRNSA